MSAHDEIDTAAYVRDCGAPRLYMIEELCAALDATRSERDKERARAAEVTDYVGDAYRRGNEYRVRALRAEAEAADSRLKLGMIKSLCVYDFGPCAEFSDAVLAVMAIEDDEEITCVPELVTQSMIDSLANIQTMSGVTEIRVKTEDDEDDAIPEIDVTCYFWRRSWFRRGWAIQIHDIGWTQCYAGESATEMVRDYLECVDHPHARTADLNIRFTKDKLHVVRGSA